MTNKLTNQISNGVPQQQSSAMTQTQTIKHTQHRRAQAAVIRTQGGAWPGQAGWARLGGGRLYRVAGRAGDRSPRHTSPWHITRALAVALRCAAPAQPHQPPATQLSAGTKNEYLCVVIPSSPCVNYCQGSQLGTSQFSHGLPSPSRSRYLQAEWEVTVTH